MRVKNRFLRKELNLLREIIRPWKKSLDFQGRASRREYIMFYLSLLIYMWIPELSGLIELLSGSSYFFLYILAPVVPFLAVLIRRLHDLDIGGWAILRHCYLIAIAPALLVILAFYKGTEGVNQFGSNEEPP